MTTTNRFYCQLVEGRHFDEPAKRYNGLRSRNSYILYHPIPSI